MSARMSHKRVLTLCVALVLAVCAVVFSTQADVLLPQTGKSVKSDGKLSVDYSHSDQGYIMVKSKKSKKKLKVRVTYKDAKDKNKDSYLNYDLNNGGDYEVFPLQFGDGNYIVALYENASGKKYTEEGKIKLKVALEDPRISFLYPNQYVNYDDKTPCVVTAGEICEGMTDQAQIYKTICDYIKGHFVYDFIKSVSVKAGVLPDIDGCWEKHKGICQDLSAMSCAMMRSQGIPAALIIGTLGSNTYHAWVVAWVNGEERFWDPTAELNASSKKETYTTERYY